MRKKFLGLVVLIIGVVLLGLSFYIKSQVEEGKGKISNAQQQVNQGNSLFSATPYTKEIGKGITGSAQEKINAAQQEVNQYDALVPWLKVGGIVLIVVGIGLVLFWRKK